MSDETPPGADARRWVPLHKRRTVRRAGRRVRDAMVSLHREGRAARSFDRGHATREDPGPQAIVEAGVDWLLAAQRESASNDGGMARNYALGRGWARSYPETTGYIVPTLLEPAVLAVRPRAREAAIRALDWLVSIQTPEGGWPGSVAGASTVPVTFNTGQIMLGVADGVAKLGRDDADALGRAGDWLVAMQDPDGAWRRGHSAFAMPGPSVYELHTAWGLAEAGTVLGNGAFVDAAKRNADWTLGMQHRNGWFEQCDLSDADRPLTHTIAYAVRGLIEVWRLGGDDRHLDAALVAARAMLGITRADGYLAGRLTSSWEPGADWCCVTGTSQIAICWALLYEQTGDEEFREAMVRANAFVRRAVRLDADDAVRGGVPGSFPIGGGYEPFELLNWAVKFTIDAQLAEQRLIRASEGTTPT